MRKTPLTRRKEADMQAAFEKRVVPFSRLRPDAGDPEEVVADDTPKHFFEYTALDFGIDAEITRQSTGRPQCCRGHIRLQGSSGRYGEYLSIHQDAGGTEGYECPACLWWRWGNLCGPE